MSQLSKIAPTDFVSDSGLRKRLKRNEEESIHKALGAEKLGERPKMLQAKQGPKQTLLFRPLRDCHFSLTLSFNDKLSGNFATIGLYLNDIDAGSQLSYANFFLAF